MTELVTREERRDDIRRTLKVIIGVMALLVAVSLATILLKH